MILTAHQTAAYPWLGLLHKISLADQFVIFDDVPMCGDSWEQRNRIKGANGEMWLTIPLKSKGYRDKKIYELEIDNTQRWRYKHWQSIYLAYCKAPSWKIYKEFFYDFYQHEWNYLTEINEYFLRWVMKELSIDVPIVKASELHFEGQKSDLVLDMCKKLKADIYIFGEQGEDYADREAFEQAGVKIYFQHYIHPTYRQQWGEFKPYMSVIDLLFNEGPRSKEIIMEGNISRENLLEGFNVNRSQ